MKTTKSMLDYLARCSQTSLESFQLARLNDLANLRKQMIDVIDEWVETDIQARISEWILLRKRHQATLRSPQSVRRIRSKQVPLPLVPSPDESSTQFPDLASHPLISVLRDAVCDDPLPALRRRSEALVKSKRIA
ncbi:MAG TPA: hypothetical protein VKT50_01220 [Candidatus Acidoferrales bacterium]|nr:hypothetical protein [Candidatus Acidoferrales bacterium]